MSSRWLSTYVRLRHPRTHIACDRSHLRHTPTKVANLVSTHTECHAPATRTNETVDILPTLKGEDSHERRPAELGCLRFAHRRGAGHAKWPLLLSSNRTLPPFPAGYERLSADSEVLGCLASVPNLSRRGTFEHRSGSPILSDCPGMGADRPRRIGIGPHGEHLRLCHTLKVDDDGDSSPPLRARLSRLQLRNR